MVAGHEQARLKPLERLGYPSCAEGSLLSHPLVRDGALHLLELVARSEHDTERMVGEGIRTSRPGFRNSSMSSWQKAASAGNRRAASRCRREWPLRPSGDEARARNPGGPRHVEEVLHKKASGRFVPRRCLRILLGSPNKWTWISESSGNASPVSPGGRSTTPSTPTGCGAPSSPWRCSMAVPAGKPRGTELVHPQNCDEHQASMSARVPCVSWASNWTVARRIEAS